MCCSVGISVCLVCCELLGETICNVFGFRCDFVNKCYRCFSVGGGALLDIHTMYGLPKNVCVVPVIPVCI